VIGGPWQRCLIDSCTRKKSAIQVGYVCLGDWGSVATLFNLVQVGCVCLGDWGRWQRCLIVCCTRKNSARQVGCMCRLFECV